MSESRLNPQIRRVEVGTRELRELKIYPLSLADQNELLSLLVDVINEATQSDMDVKSMTEEEGVKFVQDLIQNNVTKIISFVTDLDETPAIDELTNDQFIRIANIIFEVNFEGLIKNSKDLFERAKGLFRKEQIPTQ